MSEYICIEHNSPACNECVRNFQNVEADLKAKLETAEKGLAWFASWIVEFRNGTADIPAWIKRAKECGDENFRELESRNASLVREAGELREKVRKGRSALFEFGQHKYRCSEMDSIESLCSCGLDRSRDNLYLKEAIQPTPSDQSSKMTGEEDEPSSIVERGNEQIVLTEKGVFFNGVPPASAGK